MTAADEQDQNDVDLDMQDDLDQGQEPAGAKPTLKEAFHSNPLLKVGAAILIAAIAIGAYTTVTKPNPVEETKSYVTGVDTASIKATPGKDALDNKYTEAVQKKNEQRAEAAKATGASALPTPVATAKEQGLAIPQQTRSGPADPLQEWKNSVAVRRIKSEETNLEEDIAQAPPKPDLVPMVQPVRPQAVAKADPQQASALAGQMRTIVAAQVPIRAKVLGVTTKKSAYVEMQEAATKAAAATTASGGAAGTSAAATASAASTKAKERVIIPAGNIFYAQLLTEMNSDIPAPALATVMSGPFTGGRAIGKMTKQDEYLVITFDRIVKDDVSYKINGIALDEATTLPALQSEVDHHYFDRVILPAAAKFVTGYADSVSETGTSTTTTSGGGVATETPKPDAKESLYAGLTESANAVSEALVGDAKKEITVLVHRGTTMGVLVLDTVTTGSVEK